MNILVLNLHTRQHYKMVNISNVVAIKRIYILSSGLTFYVVGSGLFKICFYFLSDNFHTFIINRVFGCRVPGPRRPGLFAVSFKRVRRKKKKKRCTGNLPSKTWPWKNFCSPNFHFHFLDHGDHYSWSRPPASQ